MKVQTTLNFSHNIPHTLATALGCQSPCWGLKELNSPVYSLNLPYNKLIRLERQQTPAKGLAGVSFKVKKNKKEAKKHKELMRQVVFQANAMH